jgi:hypothetical protein
MRRIYQINQNKLDINKNIYLRVKKKFIYLYKILFSYYMNYFFPKILLTIKINFFFKSKKKKLFLSHLIFF